MNFKWLWLILVLMQCSNQVLGFLMFAPVKFDWILGPTKLILLTVGFDEDPLTFISNTDVFMSKIQFQAKSYKMYEREKKPVDNLTDEDKFMMQVRFSLVNNGLITSSWNLQSGLLIYLWKQTAVKWNTSLISLIISVRCVLSVQLGIFLLTQNQDGLSSAAAWLHCLHLPWLFLNIARK